MTQEDRVQLAYSELNEHCSTTIVFIHGGFSNSRTWDLTTDCLKSYHLIVPDLPGHGRTRKTVPSFSIVDAAEQVASLIRLKAKNGGKAHIVGLSLGAHVALQITTKHQDVVDTAFLTGYNVYPSLNSTVAASIGWFGTRIGNLFPESQEQRDAKVDADGNTLPPMPYSYWRAVLKVICTEVWPKPWPARTLILAAGDRGGSPVTDRPWSARKLQEIGRQGNSETIAYWNDKLIHDWPRAEGQLCAEVVQAWINKTKLPQDFVPL